MTISKAKAQRKAEAKRLIKIFLEKMEGPDANGWLYAIENVLKRENPINARPRQKAVLKPSEVKTWKTLNLRKFEQIELVIITPEELGIDHNASWRQILKVASAYGLEECPPGVSKKITDSFLKGEEKPWRHLTIAAKPLHTSSLSGKPRLDAFMFWVDKWLRTGEDCGPMNRWGPASEIIFMRSKKVRE